MSLTGKKILAWTSHGLAGPRPIAAENVLSKSRVLPVVAGLRNVPTLCKVWGRSA